MKITNTKDLKKAQDELNGLEAMLNRYADYRNFIRDIQRKHPGVPESAIWKRFDVLKKAIDDYYENANKQ